MIAQASQPFIRAVAQSYDAWAYPEQHAQMIAQSQNLSDKDVENTREIPQELAAQLPPELSTMVAAQAATIDDWIQLSGIFSPDRREVDVDFSAAEKLASLLEAAEQQKGELEFLQEELESRTKAIKKFQERFSTDPKARKAALEKGQKHFQSLSLTASVLPTPRTELLKHILVRSFTHATEQQKDQIVQAANALRPHIRAQLSWFNRGIDKAWGLFSRDSLNPHQLLFITSIALLCLGYTYLLYYLIHTVLAPWIIQTAAPLVFNSTHCPVLAAKVGQAAVGAFAWVVNHKKYQVLLTLGTGFLCGASKALQLKRTHRFFEKCSVVIGGWLPFTFVIQRGFELSVRILGRVAPFMDREANMLRFHCAETNKVPVPLRSQRCREEVETLRLWLDLVDFVEKERAKKAATPRA